MNEADKKRIFGRLENMRGEILAKIRSRERKYETETPSEQPYVFLRQRVEKPGEVLLALPAWIEWLRFITVAVFRLIHSWR